MGNMIGFILKRLLLIVLATSISTLDAQSISIFNNQTATTLANYLVGNGITVSGATLNCNSLANGLFVNVNPSPNLSLAIDSGIVLCTGRVLTATPSNGTNADRFLDASTNWANTTTDAQITQIAGVTAVQRDLCFLQFTFVPQGDSAFLNYTFASEEYPDFNCTSFNDAFGIFVAPPSSSLYTNYSKVPGTNINIGINSVNNGTPAGAGSIAICSSLGTGSPFTAFYVDNQVANHVVYDGMTKNLLARIPTTPNQAHTMKVAIADIKDGLFDSGIFLKKSSFTSSPLLQITGRKSTSGITTNPSYLIEGCNAGSVTLTRSSSSSTLGVNVTFSGNTPAGNFSGASSFSFPIGSTIFNYNISAIQNNLPQGVRNLIVRFSAPSISFLDSVSFEVKDFANGITVFNATNDTTVCNNRVISLYSTNTDPLFTRLWTPSTGLSCTSCNNPNYTVNNGNVFSTQNINYNISALGCPSVDSVVSINIHPKPVVTLFNKVVCLGDSVAMNPTVSPSFGPLIYTWTPSVGLTASNIANPFAKPTSNQLYKLVVSTSIGCRDSSTATVSVSNIRSEIDSIRSMNATCGQNNGFIRLYTKNTFPVYQFSINGGATFSPSGIFNTLTAATYNVAIRNGSNCRFDTTLTISSGTTPPAATFSVTNTSCALNNGSAMLTSKSGNGPFTYQWRSGSTVISTDTFIANRPSGVHTLVITDINGCFTQYAFNIASSLPLGIAFTKVDQSCSLPNGSISSSPINGTAPYIYAWGTGGSTASITGLTAGTYRLTLTDFRNCVKIDSINILNFPAPILSKSSTNANCGTNIGSGTVTLTTPSTPPYIYAWSNGVTFGPTNNTTHSLGGLGAGTYFVSVTDNKGCVRVDSVIITSTPALNTILTRVNASCGNANGTITNTPSGGSAPYTYLWNDGIITKDRSGLLPGIYGVTITDGNGCTTSNTITIAMNSNPILTLSRTNSTCGQSNGSIASSMVGGISPITYSWSTGGTGTFISGISSGSYTLTITDSFGCQRVKTEVIPPSPGANYSDTTIHTTCGFNTGSITISNITGVAPITFLWADGITSSSRTNLAPGTYSLYMIDSNGCNKTKSFTVNASTRPVLGLDTVVNALCLDTLGSIKPVLSSGVGPYSYLWSSGQTTKNLLNRAVGTYTLTVTDSKGCTGVRSYTILRFPSPKYKDTIIQPTCGFNMGGIKLTNIVGNSPYNFSWSVLNAPNDSSLMGIDTGTYYLTITDIIGCIVKDTFKLTHPGRMQLDSLIVVRPSCADSNGKMTIYVSKGFPPYTYLWSNGDKTQVADSLKHGTYSVTVTDSTGCNFFSTREIRNATNLTVGFDSIRKTRCDSATGKVWPTAYLGTAPYKYIWNAKDTWRVKDSLNLGQAQLRVIDSNKCIFDTSLYISYTHTPRITLDSVKPEICDSNNGHAYITIDSAISPLKIYWNSVLDSTYANKKLQGTSLLAPNVFVTVVDSQKCTANLEIIVPFKPMLNATLYKHLPACGANTGYLLIQSSFPPSTAVWSNGKTNLDSIAGLAPGTYTLTLTDSSNCVYNLKDSLAYSIAPTATYQIKRSNCGRADGQITASVISLYGIDTRSWKKLGSSVVRSVTDTLSAADSGIYLFTYRDIYGCTRTDTVYIKDSAAPSINSLVTHSNCTNGVGKIRVSPTSGAPPHTYVWNNFATADSIVNLFAGTYTLTVTDSRACTSNFMYTILFRTTPQVSLISNNSLCGPSNGSVATNIALGSAPFSYSWSNGQTSATATNLSAGKHIVTVTDLYGCKAVDSTVLTSQPALTTTVSKSNSNCNFNNGSVNAIITTGTSPYSYNWNGSIVSLNLSSIDTGRFIFSVTDANSCVKKDTLFVTRVPIHQATQNVVHDNCTYKQGQISTTVSSGVPPYTYNWSSSLGTNKDVSGLGGGTYTLSITDALSCLVTKVVTVNDTAGPVVALNKTDPSCGLNNGSVTAFVTSTRTPLQYFWNGVPGTTSISTLNGGKFIFKVIDSRTCQKIDSIVMDTVYPLTIANNSKMANCNVSNGFIKINANGGTKPYTYTWGHTLSNTDSVFGLGATKYYFTVTDIKGCQKSDSVTITQKGLPTISFTKTNSKCKAANGNITASVGNSTGALTYTWIPNVSSSNIASNILAGSYTLNVIDQTGCSVSSLTSIVSQGVDSITLDIVQAKCAIANGKVKATPVNTAGTPVYAWSNGATIDSVINLNTGAISVTVSDNFCTKIATANITNTTKPALSLSKQDATCAINNAIATAAVSLGTSPYFYLWSNLGSTNAIGGLDSGAYSVVVTDNLGCKDSMSIYIPRIPTISATYTVTKSKCGGNDGAISSSTSGGVPSYTYAWSSGETSSNISSKVAGNYTLTISDNGRCTVINNITIGDQTKPKITAKTLDAVCNKSNGNIKAGVLAGTGTKPFTYQWNTGQTVDSIWGLAKGFYFLTITDSIGCRDTARITVDNGATPDVEIDSINSTCGYNNGMISASLPRGVDPILYNWSNGSTNDTIFNVASGNYVVTINDARGCTIVRGVSISTTTVPDITLAATQSFCLKSNGTITSTVNFGTPGPGFKYVWSNSGTTANISGLSPGLYKVTVSDLFNCFDTASIVITERPNLLAATIVKTDLKCNNNNSGQIVVNAVSGATPYKYKTLSTPYSAGITIGGLPAGPNSYTVEDNDGCLFTDTFSLGQPLPIVSNLIDQINLKCNNEPTGVLEVSLSGGTGPYGVQWFPSGRSTFRATNLLAGAHRVDVIDGNGCLATYNYNLSQPSELALASKITNNNCNGESLGKISVVANQATPPYRYQWQNNSTKDSLTKLPQGNYKLTVTDANSCIDTFVFPLIDPPKLKVDNVMVKNTNCINIGSGELEVIASGGFGRITYSRDSGRTFSAMNKFNFLLAGRYYVIIKDLSGCRTYVDTIIKGPSPFKIVAIPKKTTIDLGGQVELGYRVLVGDSSQILSRIWSESRGLSCVDCDKPIAAPYIDQQYVIDVQFTDDCHVYDTVYVIVKDKSKLYIPNVLAPAAMDPENKVFKIYGKNILHAKLSIFNRWGEKVFSADNANIEGWDGTFKGQQAPFGIYTYLTEITYTNQRKEKHSGTLSLIR
jgi:gliding motility-associated-like protein